jgi:hypothetical protein
MPESVVRLLRTVVLRTNPHWPFRHCNRVPYAAAMRAFVGCLQTRPEISSIYVRHGLAQTEWIPALSDIDLTLILRRNLPAELEYDFLRTFWKRYGRLKRIFPMLGEVEILNKDEFPFWLTSSSYSPFGRRWRLLHGEQNTDLAADGSPHWRRRALSFALWIHLALLPACVSMPDSFLRRQDIQRRAHKILRLLQPILAEAGQPPLPMEQTSDPVEALTNVLRAFETAVKHVVSSEPHDDISEPAGPLPTVRVGCDFLPTPIPGAESIYSVILRPDHTALFLIEDGLERRAIGRLVRASQHGWPGVQATPILLHRCLFAYLVRHENPFYYSRLLCRRTVAFGTDPLAKIDPPSRAAFVDYTLDRISNVLTFTRSEHLLAAARPLSLSDIEVSLNRALAARLLLRSGWISPQPQENAARGRATFPECFRAFEEIKGHVAASREEAARQASFHLFRSLASDIRDLMSYANREGRPASAAGGRIEHR